MKRVVDDARMMLRVCELYYQDNLGQKEIAEVMQISRPTVSRLLTNARERGIVRIILTDITGRKYIDLEHRLEKKYGLNEAIVIEPARDAVAMRSALGQAAAQYLERILKNGNTVGVSMGTTLEQIPLHVNADYIRGLTFVPLVGGVGENASFFANHFAEKMAQAFGGTALALHAPAMVSRVQTKLEFLQEGSISRILSRANSMDVALSGIGALDPHSTLISAGYFSREMVEDFARFDICGDICMRFFDRSGNPSRYEHNQRIVGVELEVLRKAPISIGVAGGIRKAAAIEGALAGKFINVLITDKACADILAEQAE